MANYVYFSVCFLACSVDTISTSEESDADLCVC